LITIGIDPHKASVTAAALDGYDTVLAELRLPTTADTAAQLAFAARWPVRRWAVEGATGLGHTVAQQLLATGETVLDVPPSSPPARGYWAPATPARPMRPTPPRRPPSRSTTGGSARSQARIPTWCCDC
jgi:hypothetical protein